MQRLLILPFILLALLAAACGGDKNDADDDTATANTADAATATPTPPLLPTPARANDDDVILTARAGETDFKPTLKEFRDLPKTKVDARGQKEGVSLNEIARKVSAPADVLVTVEGFRSDGRVIQFVRQPLKDIGAESVLLVDESGRLRLVSSKIPESEWLVNVTVISFP